MASIESHRDLIAWQKAIQLVTKTYRLTKNFPNDERFGLTNQIRRAVVSIAANIAEGKGRGTPKEFVRFLNIANGSLTEVDTHYVIARNLDYIQEQDLTEVVEKLDELGRIITGLRKSIESRF